MARCRRGRCDWFCIPPARRTARHIRRVTWVRAPRSWVRAPPRCGVVVLAGPGGASVAAPAVGGSAWRLLGPRTRGHLRNLPFHGPLPQLELLAVVHHGQRLAVEQLVLGVA